MRVIHLGYSDNYGGASVAMRRIHEAVSLQPNVHSSIAVINKISKDSSVVALNTNLIHKIWYYFIVRAAYKTVQILQKTIIVQADLLIYFRQIH